MAEWVLVISKDSSPSSVGEILRNKMSYNVKQTANDEAALRWLSIDRGALPQAVLVDIQSLGEAGIEAVRSISSSHARLSIIALIPYGDDVSARQALRAGAMDFLSLPCTEERFSHTLKLSSKTRHMSQYIEWLERSMSGHVDFSDIIGEHPLIKEALQIAYEASSSKVPVWIEGQQGTGKEALARAIHGGSNRAGKPFIMVNCQMLPEHMAAQILFGRQVDESGAVQFLLGKLREADGGTLLLEEPQYLSDSIKNRLLEHISGSNVINMNAKADSKLDVRIMCITSKGHEPSHDKLSASPLYDHLRSTIIVLPPLSDRKSDIPALADYYLVMYSASHQKLVRGLSPQAIDWLLLQSWPGNIQQLSNTLLRAITMTNNEWLDKQELMSAYIAPDPSVGVKENKNLMFDEQGKVKTLRSIQEEVIRFTLEQTNGCMTKAAKSLGIGRSTLYRKLDEFSIVNQTSRANHTTRPTMRVSSSNRS